MRISEIQHILEATMLTGAEMLEQTIMAAGGADTMEDILRATAEGSVLLTGVTDEHTIRTAKVAGVGVVVFVRGKQPQKSIVDLARTYEIPLMVTQYPMFVACGRLYMNGLRGLDDSW